jgi:hypothetical protein
MRAYTLLFVVLATLAGCDKYGPAPESQAEVDPAGSPAPALGTLTERVAVPYVAPEAKFTLRCDLNSVGGVGLEVDVAAAIDRAAGVVFNGWVVDESMSPPDSFVIVLAGAETFGILTKPDTERPDVAEAMGSAAALNSGFGVLVDITAVKPGEYRAYLLLPQRGVACDTGKRLAISAN